MMPRGLDRLTDGGNVVGDPRGGVDLDRQYGLDLARRIASKARLDLLRAHRTPPITLEHFHFDAEPRRGVTPADGETPALQHQNLVALRQHVGERGLPRTVPVGNVDVRATRGSEQPAEVAQQAISESHE
jgi:hypothetical protein